MIFDWYKIFNLTDWLSAGIPSRVITVLLDGKGETEFHITQGNTTNITVGDVFLPIRFADKNPFVSPEGIAVYVDDANDVYVGYPPEVF